MEENFQLEKEKYIKNTNNKKETTIKPFVSFFTFNPKNIDKKRTYFSL